MGEPGPYAVPGWVTYPEKEWLRATPAEMGFDPVGLTQLLSDSSPRPAAFGGFVADPTRWGAVLTRGGYLIQSWGNPAYRYQSASLGKNFTWVLAGLAMEDGLVGLDDLIRETWTGEKQLSHPHKYLDCGHHRTLTWRHLLERTGGFVVGNGYHWRKRSGGAEWDIGKDYYGGIPEWAKWTGDPFYDNYAHVRPGETRHYSSGGYWRLTQALTALWDRDLKDLLDERLFSHMGVPADRWEWTPGRVLYETRDWYPAVPGYGEYCDPPYEINGHIVRGGPGWVVMNSEGLARFGLLVATRGIWNGERLLGAEYLPDLRYGVGIHVTSGDTDSYIAIGKVNAAGIPPLEAFRKLATGSVVGCGPAEDRG